MQTLVADHPLIAHKLTALRDVQTETPTFRRLADELVTLLAYEATRNVRVEPVTVTTPIGSAEGVRLTRPTPLIVPVLRAGIGMLDGMTRLLPSADVGFVGMARDESTLIASTYAERLPADLSGREAFVLDPMLATGGTLEAAIRMLVTRGAAAVTAICLLAAPEGIARIEQAFPGDEPTRPGGHRGRGPAAQRAGLHRPRPGRRRRPAVRRHLASPTAPARAGMLGLGTGSDGDADRVATRTDLGGSVSETAAAAQSVSIVYTEAEPDAKGLSPRGS